MNVKKLVLCLGSLALSSGLYAAQDNKDISALEKKFKEAGDRRINAQEEHRKDKTPKKLEAAQSAQVHYWMAKNNLERAKYAECSNKIQERLSLLRQRSGKSRAAKDVYDDIETQFTVNMKKIDPLKELTEKNKKAFDPVYKAIEASIKAGITRAPSVAESKAVNDYYKSSAELHEQLYNVCQKELKKSKEAYDDALKAKVQDDKDEAEKEKRGLGLGLDEKFMKEYGEEQREKKEKQQEEMKAIPEKIEVLKGFDSMLLSVVGLISSGSFHPILFSGRADAAVAALNYIKANSAGEILASDIMQKLSTDIPKVEDEIRKQSGFTLREREMSELALSEIAKVRRALR